MGKKILLAIPATIPNEDAAKVLELLPTFSTPVRLGSTYYIATPVKKIIGDIHELLNVSEQFGITYNYA